MYARLHVVRSGESLDSIAKLHGLPGWRAIYEAPENSTYRAQRPNPNSIHPGDRIYVPLAPAEKRAMTEATVRRLQRARDEAVRSFAQLEAEIDSDWRGVNKVKDGVDVAATVINIGKSLTKITYSGAQAVKKTGEELAKANRALAKDAVQFAYEPIAEAAGKAYADTLDANDPAALAFGKCVLQAWFDINSPSFWANKVLKWTTGESIEDAYNNAKDRLRRTRQEALTNIDRRISELQRQLHRGFASPTVLNPR